MSGAIFVGGTIFYLGYTFFWGEGVQKMWFIWGGPKPFGGPFFGGRVPILLFYF